MQTVKSFTPAALNATGLAAAVATVFATVNTYALSAGSAADSLAHLITFAGLAATNYSSRTVTVTGTDADGNVQSEAIAGPNGVATVTTTKHFLTVTSVTMSGATSGADTFNIGWAAESTTPTIGLEGLTGTAPYATAITLTGTINVSLQETPEAFTNLPQQNGFWSAPTALASKATSFAGNGSYSMRCVRGLVNSITAGATMRLVVAQAANR